MPHRAGVLHDQSPSAGRSPTFRQLALTLGGISFSVVAQNERPSMGSLTGRPTGAVSERRTQ